MQPASNDKRMDQGKMLRSMELLLEEYSLQLLNWRYLSGTARLFL